MNNFELKIFYLYEIIYKRIQLILYDDFLKSILDLTD